MGAKTLENFYCRLGRSKFLKKQLGIGALVNQYSQTLQGNPQRIALMPEYRILVDIHEFSGMCSYFFGEFILPWFIPKLMADCRCFFDVGANMGQWSLLATSLMKEGNTYAFEPNPIFARSIRESAFENQFKSVQVIENAASDTTGDCVDFYLSTDSRNSGTSSMIYHGFDLDSAHKISARTLRLDDFVKTTGIASIDLMKIDVERAEGRVIRGMTQILSARSIRFLVIELPVDSPVRAELESYGYYCLGAISPESGKLLSPTDLNPDLCFDFIFESVKGALQPYL